MYKLSNLAADDFSGIYDDTLVNFGVAQADSYTDDLEHILESIIRSPLIMNLLFSYGARNRNQIHS